MVAMVSALQQQQGKPLNSGLPIGSFILRHGRVCLDFGNLKTSGLFIQHTFLTLGIRLWTIHIMAKSIIKLHSLLPPQRRAIMTYNSLSPPNGFKPRKFKECSGGGGYSHTRFNNDVY